jgi:CRP/FNR family cyclic AMP-dependent transcriptional regulator
LVLVSQTSFKTCLTENPALALKLIRALTRRIRSLTEIVKNLALQDVYGRVIRTLVSLAEEKEEGLVIDQKLTHQDLANMVGASREMVTRILKELNSGGYIQIRNKIITIMGKLPPAW